MDVNVLIATLTEGLPAEQAAIVRQAIERDAVKQKATGWKSSDEYVALQQQAQQAQQYQIWYEQNYPEIKRLSEAEQARLAEQNRQAQNVTQQAQQAQIKTMSPEEIQAEVDKRIGTQYAPRWSEVVVKTGKILQKHLLAGRKTEVDFDKLAAEANEKFNGDLVRAYEEWDKPERERLAKEDTEKEITRRVNEEIARRGSAQHFPVKEDSSHGGFDRHSKEDMEKFDRSALNRELNEAFIAAGNGESVQ